MKNFFWYLLVFSVVISCKNNRLKVDVSEVSVTANFDRLDSFLFETPAEKFGEALEVKIKTDSAWMHQYFLGALNFGYYPFKVPIKDSLMVFANDSMAREIYGMVKKEFGDLQKVKEEITNACRYLRYHFPKIMVPRFVFYTHGSSTFALGNSFGTFAYPNAIGISLDGFLGKAAAKMYESNMKLNLYQIRTMAPEYVVVAAIRSLCNFHFPSMEEGNFLGRAIEEGKRQYILDAMLPDVHDSIKLSFTSAQFAWMEKNQAAMWEYFITRKLLFVSDHRKISDFFIEGPFTNAEGVPQACPPRLGAYLGWRIVSAYMNRHPQVTLPQFMKETRYEYVLKESEYKPK